LQADSALSIPSSYDTNKSSSCNAACPHFTWLPNERASASTARHVASTQVDKVGTGGADAVVCYDKLAHGWFGPSSDQHDAVYCMPIWVGETTPLKIDGDERLEADVRNRLGVPIV
jgi:hypothetical protein